MIPLCIRRLIRPETIFFILCWCGLMAKFRERAFNDPGAFWHIKVGQLILNDGFMTTDPFTFTFTGKTWIPQQWGGEVLMALAHGIAGWDALLLGMCTLLAGLFTWLFYRLTCGGMHPLFAGVITFFALFAGAYHYYARPHMATLLLMPVFMAAIVDFERGRASSWRLFWLIPLGIIWTNLHGGVLGGVFTLGLAVAGWGLLFLFKQASPIPTWRSAWFLLAVLAACLLTPFVNPFGMEMLHTWKRIVGSTAMKEYVSEHQPLSLSNTAGQVTAAFGVFYLFALAGTFHHRPKVSWLLPLVWFALSIQGIRQGPLFAVLAVVALADFWHKTVWHSLLKKYGDSLAREVVEARTLRGAGIPACLVLLAFLLQVANLPVPLLGSGWAKLDVRHNPMELKAPLQEFALHAPAGTRIFNDANLGGYVLYHAPQLKIFMDDRFELYGDDWMRNYVEVIYTHPERIEDWADTYGFDHAVILIEPERIPLEKYLAESPRWETIARGNRGAMFRRLPGKDEFSLMTE